jgi:hypothetical protein
VSQYALQKGLIVAVVRKIEHLKLERDAVHSEAACTYSIITDNGTQYLQIDTYGSKERQIPGKKSQSIRFAPEAIQQLRELIAKHFQKP